jgi:hypothetical protein
MRRLCDKNEKAERKFKFDDGMKIKSPRHQNKSKAMTG